MEDKKAINVYEYLTSFFLPEGMLDFFEVVWADEMSLSSREQKQAIVYKRVLKVHPTVRRSSRLSAPTGSRNRPSLQTFHRGTAGWSCTSAVGGG